MRKLIEARKKFITEQHSHLLQELQKIEVSKQEITTHILYLKGAVTELDKILEELKKDSISKNIKVE